MLLTSIRKVHKMHVFKMFITAVCVISLIKEKSPGNKIVKVQTSFPGYLPLKLEDAGNALGTRLALSIGISPQATYASACSHMWYVKKTVKIVRCVLILVFKRNENNGLVGLITYSKPYLSGILTMIC